MDEYFAVRHRCPACGSVAVRRSKQRGTDRVHLLRSPYRCRGCSLRFWTISTRAWAFALAGMLVVAAGWGARATWNLYDELLTASENARTIERAVGAAQKTATP